MRNTPVEKTNNARMRKRVVAAAELPRQVHRLRGCRVTFWHVCLQDRCIALIRKLKLKLKLGKTLDAVLWNVLCRNFQCQWLVR